MCERYIDWLPLTCPQLGTWPKTQARALTRNQTGNLSVLRQVLNPVSHTSLGSCSSFLRLRHLTSGGISSEVFWVREFHGLPLGACHYFSSSTVLHLSESLPWLRVYQVSPLGV